jgi:hypothetical protein
MKSAVLLLALGSLAANAANVYVTTAAGVNVYGATSAGKLTAVKGSLFTIKGTMMATNKNSDAMRYPLRRSPILRMFAIAPQAMESKNGVAMPIVLVLRTLGRTWGNPPLFNQHRW